MLHFKGTNMLKPLYSSILFFLIAAPVAADTEKPLPNTEVGVTSIQPFKAEYSIIRKSKKIGSGTRQLEKLHNNIYKYSYTTDSEWFIFSDIRTEESIVQVNNNNVIPTHYNYTRAGTGKDKSSEWTYDVAKNIATNVDKNKMISIDFPAKIQDKLSYHLQHRLNLINTPEKKSFIYPVIKVSGKISNYAYEYDGEEELMLPYGLVKAIKFKREVTGKERITYAWFAPKFNYLLVKLQQIKGGVEQFEAQLDTITVSAE